jgi:hypothetical protein
MVKNINFFVFTYNIYGNNKSLIGIKDLIFKKYNKNSPINNNLDIIVIHLQEVDMNKKEQLHKFLNKEIENKGEFKLVNKYYACNTLFSKLTSFGIYSFIYYNVSSFKNNISLPISNLIHYECRIPRNRKIIGGKTSNILIGTKGHVIIELKITNQTFYFVSCHCDYKNKKTSIDIYNKLYKLLQKKITSKTAPIFIAGDINDRPILFKNKDNQQILNINFKKGPNCSEDKFNNEKNKSDIDSYCSFLRKINKTFPTKKNISRYKKNIKDLSKKQFSNKHFQLLGFNEGVNNKGVDFFPTCHYKKGVLNIGKYLDNKMSKNKKVTKYVKTKKIKKIYFDGKNIGHPDRIFYKGKNIKCHYYSSILDTDTKYLKGYIYSDHLPVMGIYTIHY